MIEETSLGIGRTLKKHNEVNTYYDFIFNEDEFRVGYEGEQHFDLKLSAGKSLTRDGWDVMVEAVIPTDFINALVDVVELDGNSIRVDVAAVKEDCVKIIEIGDVDQTRVQALQEISDEFEHIEKEDVKKQKSVYVDDELATWIEKVAEHNDRSESYVLKKLLRAVKDSVDGEMIRLREYEV
ncbi:MAG: hypothetical protein J07AB43_01950 [Candidatus Nanosalina sp. J07AB43]|jgi:hypothetical protein|nr:MAG: hypothetical protein J07AB43_01950 [Candidatus Nanosalina sp. J07AB43]